MPGSLVRACFGWKEVLEWVAAMETAGYWLQSPLHSSPAIGLAGELTGLQESPEGWNVFPRGPMCQVHHQSVGKRGPPPFLSQGNLRSGLNRLKRVQQPCNYKNDLKYSWL